MSESHFGTDHALDRALDALSPAPPRDDAALDRVHSALRQHMAASPRLGAVPAPVTRSAGSTGISHARRWRGFGKLAIPLATAAAVAAVTVAVWPSSGSGGTAHNAGTAPAISSGSAQQLDVRLVAYTAARNVVATDTPVPAGDYLQLRTVIQQGSGRRVDTTWVPADPSSRTVKWVRQMADVDGGRLVHMDTTSGFCGNDGGPNSYSADQKLPPGDDAVASCTRAGNWVDHPSAFAATLANFDARQLTASLKSEACAPRDPDPIVREHLCPNGNLSKAGVHIMFSSAYEFMSSGVASADLVARLYKVVADLPGVTAQAGVTNADGVAGDALTYSDGGDTSTMIIDRQTGRLIGLRERTGGNEYVDAIERTIVNAAAVPTA